MATQVDFDRLALPADMPQIPAMTTPEERALFYRLALDAAGKGAVVELGAWLGASSAWIAAAMRDSGAGAKAHVYDRFLSKPGHADKVKAWYAGNLPEGAAPESAMPMGDCLPAFHANLGPLIEHVVPHQGEIDAIEWTGGPIALLINDAPKRVPQISRMLTTFRTALQPGAIMVWQDFCHFPSYEIPACLWRLRDYLEFVEAAVPGTTLAFRVTQEIPAEAVTIEALSLRRWSPYDMAGAWSRMLATMIPVEKASLFACGRAMFLCDIGQRNAAVKALSIVLADYDGDEAVIAKWRYLHKGRPDFRKRYKPLFDLLAERGLL